MLMLNRSERKLILDPELDFPELLSRVREALMHSTHPRAHESHDELGRINALLIKLWTEAQGASRLVDHFYPDNDGETDP